MSLVRKKSYETLGDQSGQGLVEYLIIVTLMAVGTIAVMRGLSETVAFKFGRVAKALGATVEGSGSAPSIGENATRKKDLSDFMQGARASEGRENGGLGRGGAPGRGSDD